MWLLRRVREGAAIIRAARRLLDREVGDDVLGLHRMTFSHDDYSHTESAAEVPAQAKSEQDGVEKSAEEEHDN